MKRLRHRSAALVVALVSVLLFSPMPAAAASTFPAMLDSEPLAASSIESSVGGVSVDKVYGIDVAPGTVLIASLRGELGAEMGLYLFSSDATSVITDTPIASAAKAGGSQVISVPIVFGGTYYLNVNGRNVDRPYKFKLTISKQKDATPPLLTSVTINRNRQSTAVCPTIKASDTLSGVTSVSVSVLGSPGALEWQTYQGQRPYCISGLAPAGSLKLSVRVRNGVGLLSKAQIISTFVDDTPPRIVKTTPTQGGNLIVERPRISWIFSEPVELQAGSDEQVVVSNQSGIRVSGQTVIASDRKSITWQPSRPIAVGTVLLLSLPSFSDDAGNLKELPDTLIVSRRIVPTLAIKSIKKSGMSLKLSVQVSKSLIGKTLMLQQFVSGSWQDWQELQAGAASFALDINRIGTAVRINYVGDEMTAPFVGKGFKLP